MYLACFQAVCKAVEVGCARKCCVFAKGLKLLLSSLFEFCKKFIKSFVYNRVKEFYN